MADASVARREARRRRILENSHNRLQFISGKSSTECVKKDPSKSTIPDFSDLNLENPVPLECSSSFFLPPVNNGMVISEADSSEFSLQSDFVAAGDRQITNDSTSFISPPPEPEKVSTFEKMIAYKYDIVILSLLIQLLYSMPLFTFDDGYFFLPLIIYVVTKLIWFPANNTSNLANALMLLNGISAQRVQKILSVSQWVGVISQDICVYLFTTICLQAVVNMLKDSWGT